MYRVVGCGLIGFRVPGFMGRYQDMKSSDDITCCDMRAEAALVAATPNLGFIGLIGFSGFIGFIEFIGFIGLRVYRVYRV